MTTTPAAKRRTVVRGALWAVPTIVICAAAPMAAASLVTSSILGGCRMTTGQNPTYRVYFTVCNSSTTDVQISVTSITLGGSALTNISLTLNSTDTSGAPTVSIPAATSAGPTCLTVYALGTYTSSSTGNVNATVNYSLSGGDTGSGSSTGNIDLGRDCAKSGLAAVTQQRTSGPGTGRSH